MVFAVSRVMIGAKRRPPALQFLRQSGRFRSKRLNLALRVLQRPPGSGRFEGGFEIVSERPEEFYCLIEPDGGRVVFSQDQCHQPRSAETNVCPAAFNAVWAAKSTVVFWGWSFLWLPPLPAEPAGGRADLVPPDLP